MSSTRQHHPTGALLTALIAGALVGAAAPPATAATPWHAQTDRGSTAAGWAWPVGGGRQVLRPFIAPPTRYGAGHRGVDLAADAPDADRVVIAPADGVVRFAGMVAGRPVLSIDHGDGVVSSLEPVASSVTAGTPVARGDPVGELLDGHCVRPCLHLGVRIDGEYANPLRWLGGAVIPVLLPTRATTPATAASVTARDGPRSRPRSRAPATRTARRAGSRATAR